MTFAAQILRTLLKMSTVTFRSIVKSTMFVFLLDLLSAFVRQVDAQISESKKSISGKVLRIIMLNYPPAVIYNKAPNGTVTYSGISIEVLDFIGRALNISYEYVQVTYADLARFGPGEAFIRLLVNKKADVALSLRLTHERFLQADPATVHQIEPFRLVVPWPNEESRLLAPIRPFQPTVWLCLGLSIICMSYTLTFLKNAYLRHVIDKKSAANKSSDLVFDSEGLVLSSLFLLSNITNHGYQYNLKMRSRGSLLLVGLWCLMAVVLANGYGGVLFSFLSVTKLQSPINSLQEWAQVKDAKLLVIDRSEPYIQTLMSATSGFEKVLGNSLRNNPGSFVQTAMDAKDKLLTGRYAFPQFNLYTTRVIDAAYRENGNKCRLTYAQEPLPTFIPTAAMFTKNGPYTRVVNEQLLILLEGGIYNHMYKKYAIQVDQCLVKNQQSEARQKSLSLVDMSSAFVVLSLGTSLSLLVFLLELVYNRIKTHHFKH